MKKMVVCAVLFALAGAAFADTADEAAQQIESCIVKTKQEQAQAFYRQEAPKPGAACREDSWFLMGRNRGYTGYGEWRMMCHNGVPQQPTEYFHLDYENPHVGFAGSFNEAENITTEGTEAEISAKVPDFFDDHVTSFLLSCNSRFNNIAKKRLLSPHDPAVAAIVKQAVRLYNENHPGEPVLQMPARQTDFVSVANLIHAIYMVHKYSGQTEFSANAVCMLGKTIGAASVDLNLGSGNAYRKNLSNMFGAFAAYMGADSIYFPGAYVKVEDKVKEDLRFGPSKQKAYNYYWEDYTDRAAYEEVLKFGPWAFESLGEIAKAVNFTPDPDADFETNRQNYWKAYEHLFTGEDSCALQEDATVNYYKLIEYLAIMCADPRVVSMKPYNQMTDMTRAIFGAARQK